MSCFDVNPRSRCNNRSCCWYRAREHVDPCCCCSVLFCWLFCWLLVVVALQLLLLLLPLFCCLLCCFVVSLFDFVVVVVVWLLFRVPMGSRRFQAIHAYPPCICPRQVNNTHETNHVAEGNSVSILYRWRCSWWCCCRRRRFVCYFRSTLLVKWRNACSKDLRKVPNRQWWASESSHGRGCTFVPFPSPPRQGMLRGMFSPACSERSRSFWWVWGRTHPQGVIPSCWYVWPQGFGVIVDLGRTWGVGHKHLRFARLSSTSTLV